MNEALQQAEQASIQNITEKMLAACDGRKIDHCIAAALSTIGNVIGDNPEFLRATAASIRKLADHLDAAAETKH